MKSKKIKENSHLIGAKLAAKKMMLEWAHWTSAKNEEKRREQFAQYAASAIACKVYIENYIKHFFPRENLPTKIVNDLSTLIHDIEEIERTSKGKLEKLLADLDRLSRDVAA